MKECPCGKALGKNQKKFCGLSCSGKSARRGQLAWEETVAKQLGQEGWEIISPTACCDRIGIKDGRVFFLEFKPEGKSALRSFQKSVRRAAPHQYRVVIGTSSGVVTTIRGDGRAARKGQHVHVNKQKGATGQFVGVSWSKARSLWRARLSVNGKRVHLGYFFDESLASRAYEDELKRRRGDVVKRAVAALMDLDASDAKVHNLQPVLIQ